MGHLPNPARQPEQSAPPAHLLQRVDLQICTHGPVHIHTHSTGLVRVVRHRYLDQTRNGVPFRGSHDNPSLSG